MEEKLRQLYDRLVQDGYELPEYSAFTQRMANRQDAEKLYSTLITDGYELPAKFDEFYNVITPPQQPQSVNEGEAIGTAIGSVSPAARGLFDFGRTLYSGLVDTTPQTAAQTLEIARTALNPSNAAEFVKNERPVDFQRYVRDRDPKYSGISGFFTPFDIEEAAAKYGEQFMKDEGLSSEIKAMEERLPGTIERRKNVEQYVQQQKQEAEQKLGGVVTDYRNINNVESFASYLGNLLGQTAYQIPLSVGTKGASSYAMEAATVYDNQLDRLADEHGISREEVIERNLDNPAAGQAYAMLAGALDATSAGNLINAFRKGGGTVLKKWLNVTSEALTEPTQGVLEEVGGGSPIEESFSEEGMARRVNELLGGFVGGAAFGLRGTEQKVKSQIKNAEAQADQAINEVGDTGDPQLNADIDAAASLDPVDKQVLEEVKVAEAVQEEQKEIEAEEKLQKELEGGTESTENAENTKTNTAKEAEIKPSQTPEYKAAVKRVEDAKKRFAELPIDASREESMRLALEITDARQELQKLIETPKDADFQYSLFDALDQKMKVTDADGHTGTLKLDAGGKLTLENSKKIVELGNLDTEIDPATSIRDFGLTLAKAPQQREEKSVKMTPNEAIKHQVQTFFRGMDKGVKKGKELSNELVAKVQEAIKDSPLKPKQISSILNKVKSTNLFTPGSISRLNNFIDKVTQDAEYADKLSEAKSLNKKLRKLSKSSNSNLQSVKGLAKVFTSINPEDTFINPHLEIANKLLGALTAPTQKGYAKINTAEVEDYITDLQKKIAEVEEEQIAKEPAEREPSRVFEVLRTSIDALKEKDLSEFDEREVSMINTLKTIDPDSYDKTNERAVKQASALVRVIDNIVENDDFSNAGSVEPIIRANENFKKAAELIENAKKKDIRGVGKVTASLYQQFARVFGESGLASDIQQLFGITDLWSAGSRVERMEIEYQKQIDEKVREIKKKYKVDVREIKNSVRLVSYGQLAMNYGDDSHIEKVKDNIRRSAVEHAKEDEEIGKAFEEVFEEVKNIKTVEEAVNQFKTKHPGLYEILQFNTNKFQSEVNEKLARTRTEIHNEAYAEANNYSHIEHDNISNTTDAQEAFMEGATPRANKIKPKAATTGITATRNLRQGMAFNPYWIESQLKGYRESLYDIEASPSKALVYNTIYDPRFDEIMGGKINADIVRKMVNAAEPIQKGISKATANDAVKFLNKTTQFLRNIGAVRALASASQIVKQPTVLVKTFMNHLGSGSVDMFFKGLGAVNLISTSPNLRKLFDQYTIGVRGERLGGIERGDSMGYRMPSTSSGMFVRVADYMKTKSDHFTHKSLTPLTKPDVYAARTSWLGYYLQRLRELGVTNVDLNSEFEKQNDPIRKRAAAFAEQMIAETQTPSNPATLPQIVRNENDGSWTFVKNLLIPFSTFSITAKYRNILDVGKFIRNPSRRNASAVAGNVFEMMVYSTVAYLVLPIIWRDVIKLSIEQFFGFESDDDEEKKQEVRMKAFYTNLSNAAIPFAVGYGGEVATSHIVNGLAYLAQDPNMPYSEWKKETGGFVFEPKKFDAGVFALGLEPFVETGRGFISLATGTGSYEAFDNTIEVELTDQQQALLAIKTLMEVAGTVGITEADVYKEVARVYKEQLKQNKKDEGTGTPRATPRPIPRPIARPRPRPLPAPNLR